MASGQEKISGKLFIYLYRGLILILPLFFLPWTAVRNGADNYNKLYLLWLVVPLLFFWQFFKRYQEKKVFYQRTILDWAIVVFLIATFLSTIASSDRLASLGGGQENIMLPLCALLTFVLFYWLNSILKIDEKETTIIIKLLSISYLIIVAGAMLIFFGVLSRSVIFTSAFKSALGSMEELAMYLAVISNLLAIVLFAEHLQLDFVLSRAQKIIIKLGLFFSLVILVIVNFIAAWTSLFLGVAFFLAVISWLEYREKGKLFFLQQFFKNSFWLILLATISLVFIVINLTFFDNALIARRFAQNLRLDSSHTWQLASSAIKHQTILGLGPETFSFAFSLWRSQDMNKSEFWSLRFDKGASYLAEIIIYRGIAGLVAYLFFIGVFF
ncbi:MAG: hypothetical protein NTW06_03035, partial [Candidatus Falkowbacteria bacterium]|nr:hypothetical protein [Candidatus Falkowbacteria bacterium]